MPKKPTYTLAQTRLCHRCKQNQRARFKHGGMKLHCARCAAEIKKTRYWEKWHAEHARKPHPGRPTKKFPPRPPLPSLPA